MLETALSHTKHHVLLNLDGVIHELYVISRPPRGEWPSDLLLAMREDAELFGKLVQATIGCWARTWQAVAIDSWEVDGQSAVEQYDIKPSTELPYVTIQNKDYNDFELTVHSDDNGELALIAAQATLWAVAAIRSTKPGVISIKGMEGKPKPPAQKKQAPPQKKQGPPGLEHFDQPYDDEDMSTSDDFVDDTIVIDARQKQEPNPTGVINLLGWYQVTNMTNSDLVLPMLVDTELRKATYATRNVSQDKELRYAVQYQDKQLVAYHAHKIERVLLGENEIPALKVHTRRGEFAIWELQKNGEQTYDFQAAEKYLARVGIDALQSFVLKQKFVYVVKVNHSGDNEYKNCYGFWREADSSNAQAESVTDVTQPREYDGNDIPF